MLVLTRKQSQLIQIGDNIVIKVIRTSSGTVKLGIDAPQDVRVKRGELNEQLAKTYDTTSSGVKTDSAATASSDANAKLDGETVVADCRLSELSDDDEPISHKSRKRNTVSVA